MGVFQIYYKQNQKAFLVPWADPFCNMGQLNPFLENDVIERLHHTEQLYMGDASGVISWAFRQKGNSAAMAAKNPDLLDLLSKYDAITFYPQYKTKKPPHNHFRSHVKGAFSAPEHSVETICFNLLRAIDRPYDTNIPVGANNVIYSNHWIARPEIYRAYVEDYLLPSMKLMREDEGFRMLAMTDSRYHKIKQPGMVARWQEGAGVPYYTMHAFVLERLPSVFFAHNPDLKLFQYE